MSNISDTSKILKNSIIGENTTIEDYCIIGMPPLKRKEGELKTIIGKNTLIRSHSVIYLTFQIPFVADRYIKHKMYLLP